MAAISRAVAASAKTLPIPLSRLFSSSSCYRVISGHSDPSDNLYSDENSLDFMPCLKLRAFLTRAEEEMLKNNKDSCQLVIFSKNPKKCQNHFVLLFSADSQAREAVRLVKQTKISSGNALQVPFFINTASKAMDIVYACFGAKEKLEQAFLSVIFSDIDFSWYEFTKLDNELPIAVQILGKRSILFDSNKNVAVLPSELNPCSNKVDVSFRSVLGRYHSILNPHQIAIDMKRGREEAKIAAALLNAKTFSGLKQCNSSLRCVTEFKIVP